MSNNITKLLTAILTPMQDIENALQQLLNERSVDTAVGVQLDIVGALVGQQREGLGDDDYRRLCRARIAANRSSGTMEDLIRVARLVLDEALAVLIFTNEGNATVMVRIQAVAVTNELALLLVKFLHDTQSAGVRVIATYGTTAPSTWFKWDTAGKGWDLGKWIGSVD